MLNFILMHRHRYTKAPIVSTVAIEARIAWFNPNSVPPSLSLGPTFPVEDAKYSSCMQIKYLLLW